MDLLKNLEYDNFIELLDYLEGLSESKIPEDIEVFLGERILNFFPDLNAVQEVELNYILMHREKSLFDAFKLEHPMLAIDSSGKSTPNKKQYWELSENALNSVYSLALQEVEKTDVKDTSYNKVNTQVYNAKNLSCLKHMPHQKYESYIYYRKLLLNKYHKHTAKEFNELEKKLKELKLEPSKFLINVVKYCYKETNDYSVFLDHLFKRVENLHADTDLTSESNKKFLANINLVIDKNNSLYE